MIPVSNAQDYAKNLHADQGVTFPAWVTFRRRRHPRSPWLR